MPKVHSSCSGRTRSSRIAGTVARTWHLKMRRCCHNHLNVQSALAQWTDAFQPDRGDGRADVAFEKAALLFNLGAIASQVRLRAGIPHSSIV